MFDSKVLNAVKLIAYLNDLAEQTRKGFFPFSQCQEDNQDTWRGGVMYIDVAEDGQSAGLELHDVAANVCVHEGGDHDIISGYGPIFEELCGFGCTVRVQLPEEDVSDAPAVCISFEDDDKTMFVVENGTWYMA